jgi:hypothetical protein
MCEFSRDARVWTLRPEYARAPPKRMQ